MNNHFVSWIMVATLSLMWLQTCVQCGHSCYLFLSVYYYSFNKSTICSSLGMQRLRPQYHSLIEFSFMSLEFTELVCCKLIYNVKDTLSGMKGFHVWHTTARLDGVINLFSLTQNIRELKLQTFRMFIAKVWTLDIRCFNLKKHVQ